MILRATCWDQNRKIERDPVWFNLRITFHSSSGCSLASFQIEMYSETRSGAMNLISPSVRLLLWCGLQAGRRLCPGQGQPLHVRGGSWLPPLPAHLSPQPAHVPALALTPAPGHDALRHRRQHQGSHQWEPSNIRTDHLREGLPPVWPAVCAGTQARANITASSPVTGARDSLRDRSEGGSSTG